jgi:hypothetical protein
MSPQLCKPRNTNAHTSIQRKSVRDSVPTRLPLKVAFGDNRASLNSALLSETGAGWFLAVCNDIATTCGHKGNVG